jgi:1-acyl-sn-glycerol-3-phosphate acyltransferase
MRSQFRHLALSWIEQRLSPETLARIDEIEALMTEAKTDAFGFTPEQLKWTLPFVALIYEYYFRVETVGIENVPPGRVLLIANHSGQVPLDGVMIGTALLLDGKPPRPLRSMVERWVPSLPYISTLFARLGQVLGTPENCRFLLQNEEAVLVFPEGARGISKTIDKAYELQEFGHGFMRLAMETGTPIIPIGVVGAEEQYPALWNLKAVARALNMPAFPISPTFFIPIVGLMPLPVKYRLHFGAPLSFEGDPDEDETVVGARVLLVKDAIEDLVQEGLTARKGIFF